MAAGGGSVGLILIVGQQPLYLLMPTDWYILCFICAGTGGQDFRSMIHGDSCAE